MVICVTKAHVCCHLASYLSLQHLRHFLIELSMKVFYFLVLQKALLVSCKYAFYLVYVSSKQSFQNHFVFATPIQLGERMNLK